ncbi:MAG: MFS transporter [Deltaproteobacteria bacterium]
MTVSDAQARSIPVTEWAPLRALVSWTLYDFATQPYYTLVLTFLFAPYFASHVAGDAALGQTIWGYGAAAASVLVAVGSPFVGAVADGTGHRKNWIALFSLILVAGLATLWLAVPDAPAGTIALVIFAFVAATAAAEFSSVVVNSMMPGLVPASALGRLSGIGWGVGYLGGLLSLALVAGLVVTNPATGKTLFGFAPIINLDPGLHEADRLVGPIAAVWFVVFVAPFFLFVPDAKPVGLRASEVRASAARQLWSTLRELPRQRDMLLFLAARMIYADGLAAIFAFGGIYGTAVFGWSALELGLFGIILTATGMGGAVIGGFFDDRAGAKTVILVSLVCLLIGALGILSVTKTTILFSIDVAPKEPGSTPFSSAGEQVFLAFAIVVGLVAAPVQAASRSLLARLAPPDQMARYFGLFAFSGKVTAFLAPFLVATVTLVSGSQRLGMAMIALFLIAGILLMLPVREPRHR